MLILNRRRVVVRMLGGALATLAAAPQASSQQPAAVPLRPGPLADDHVHQFVQGAHGNLDTTRQMLDATPRLIRATWDWGGGDFETALGGAAHMGRRDIAALVVEPASRSAGKLHPSGRYSGPRHSSRYLPGQY